jgi:glycerol kinase
MRYILSLDQGTTSSRAILFDHAGRIAGVAQHEFRQIYPQSGWVEHDPMDILTSQMSAAVEVLTRAGAGPRDLAAIGITNQRETTIVWDRETGKPIANAIVWQDRRTADHCRKLAEEGLEDTVRARTGLRLDPYFSATKAAWLLNHVDGARERARQGKLAFGTVDSWLIWNLTGGKRHVTDTTNASRTMLFNIREGRWDAELLDRLQIPASMMPEVVASSQQIGEVTALGLGSVPIAGIAGDQQAALFGQLCTRPGDSKNTYGTGCFLLEHIGAEFLQSKHRLITTLAASTQQRLEYALEGSIFIGGAVVQWLRDNLRLVWNSSDIESLAMSVPDSGGVVFVPAFAGLGAPHWDPNASGLIIGIHRGTTAGHIARAALESIAFQVADVFDAMQSETGHCIRELRVDGGAAANDLMMQFQADVLGLPVVRPAMMETTALGAAYLAGLACGFWSNTEELHAHRHEDTRFTPRIDPAALAARRARWHNAVERSRGWNEL